MGAVGNAKRFPRGCGKRLLRRSESARGVFHSLGSVHRPPLQKQLDKGWGVHPRRLETFFGATSAPCSLFDSCRGDPTPVARRSALTRCAAAEGSSRRVPIHSLHPASGFETGTASWPVPFLR